MNYQNAGPSREPGGAGVMYSKEMNEKEVDGHC